MGTIDELEKGFLTQGQPLQEAKYYLFQAIHPQPPGLGRRRSAIILHGRVSSLMRSSSFLSLGRSCSIDLEWGGWTLRLVNSHLFAANSLQDYVSSLEDLEILCMVPSANHRVIVGVDAQAVFGTGIF